MTWCIKHKTANYNCIIEIEDLIKKVFNDT